MLAQTINHLNGLAFTIKTQGVYQVRYCIWSYLFSPSAHLLKSIVMDLI